MTLNFTKEQRAILINQMEILKKVDKANEKEYEKKIFALHCGFSKLYSELIGEIDDELEIDIQNTVYDVFKMYRDLNHSYNKLSPEEQEQIEKEDLLFKGYDGHSEAAYLLFANFIIRELDHFVYIKKLLDSGEIESLDSHYSTLSYYKKLLPAWKHFNKAKENQLNSNLSLEEIKEILGK